MGVELQESSRTPGFINYTHWVYFDHSLLGVPVIAELLNTYLISEDPFAEWVLSSEDPLRTSRARVWY